MNDQSETERGSAVSHWFGLDQLRLSDGEHGIDVTVGPASHWDRSHLRRLRQSGDLPGMVPIIDADFSADGKPFAVTPVVESPTLSSLLETGDLSWTNGAGIAEATARAIHEAHLRGLFHGAVSPADVHVLGNDVAISGVGLGLGGRLPADRQAWAAPEVRDGADPTERSDVYSLGKVLEASLGSAIDTAPRSIRRLIMWSSSDTPEARPPSAMEFASILAEGLGEERKTYGPAFISTSEMNDLATRASSAVSSHTPSETARSIETNVGSAGIAAAGAAAAAGAGVGALAGQIGDPEADAAADTGTGFEVADTDPGTTIDAEVTAPVPAGIPTETAPVVAASQAVSAAEDAAEDDDDAPVTAGRSQFVHEYAMPAAAQTVDLDETYLPRKQRRRAGLMFAGILVLGLAAIAWGIVASGNNDDSAIGDGSPASVSEAATTPSSEAPSSSVSEAPSSSVTEAPATSQQSQVLNTATTPTSEATTVTTAASITSTTAAPTTATTATTAAPTTATTKAPTTPTTPTPTAAPTTVTTTAAPATTAAPLVPQGGMAASEAAVQVLHGVPGAEVDVYVNGKALTTGFNTGEIAGPVKLTAGSYDVALFAAQAKAPEAAADRTDKPLISQKVTVGAEPATLVAHLDDKGQPTLTAFKEDLSPVAPGQSRVVLRNLMADGAVDASVNGTIVGSIAAGQEVSAVVPAGTAKIEFVGDDGKVLTSANVIVGDGELASLSAIGAPASSTAQIVIERFTGLSTAPAGVPTGDSGLLGTDDDQAGLKLVYGLMVVLALSGGVVAFRRQRSWS